MNKINTEFETVIQDINSMPSSILSKSDVIEVLTNLRKLVLISLDSDYEQLMVDITSQFSHNLERTRGLIDYDSAEFEFENQNTIVLTNVEFDQYAVEGLLSDILQDTFAEFGIQPDNTNGVD